MKVLVRHRVVMLGLLAVGLCAGAADHEVLTWKSGDNWLEGVWTDAGGNEVTWTDGSIARTYGQNIGANKSCEVTAYAFYWDWANRVVNPSLGKLVIHLDEGGFVQGDNNGSARFMNNNLTIDLLADQTWSAPKGNGNGYAELSNSAHLTTACGATLTLADYLDLQVLSKCEYPGPIVVQGQARLLVGADGSIKATSVTLKGSAARLGFVGDSSAVADEIILTDGGRLDLDGQRWTSSKLTVTGSGVCVLAGTLTVPHGSSFAVDVAEGATLKIEGLVADEETGLPVAPIKSGEGTLLQTVLVGDDPVTSSPLVVGATDKVLVYGDGLGSDVVVQLNGGQLRFVADATVAAKVEVHAASRITVDEGVTGTVSGKIDSMFNDGTAANLLTFDGKGLKVLSGGAEFNTKAQFELIEGSALAKDGDWTFDGQNTFQIHEAAGTLSVSNAIFDAYDGGNLTVDIGVKGATGGILELLDGGVLSAGPGSHVRPGAFKNARGTFRVAGGRFYDKYANAQTVMCLDTTATGIVEIVSGTFAPASVLRTIYPGMSLVHWTGGTWLFDNSNCSGLVGVAQASGNSPSSVRVLVDGPDCTMTFKNTKSDCVISTVDAGLIDATQTEPYAWTCTERGCLTLTNATANKSFTFNVRAPFTNMNLRVCERIKVAVAADCPPLTNLNNWVVGPGSVSYADAFADGTEPFARKGISVIRGGQFDFAVEDAGTFENLALADGAALTSSVVNGKLDLTGTLFLPAQGETLNYLLPRGYQPGALITAAGGVTGTPSFVAMPGSRKVDFAVGANDLSFSCRGSVLLVR